MMEYVGHQDVEQRLFELTNATPPHLMFPLRDLAREVLATGYPREQLIEDFERARAEMRERDEEREDAVMDVMDFLYGFGSTQMKL